MLFSAIGAIGDKVDSKFLTAYFFPAFVAVLGSILILVASVGGPRLVDRIEGLDSVEQTIAVAVIVLATMMLAYLLSALARPIALFYAGRVLPPPVREWSIREQLKARARNRTASIQGEREDRLYPQDPADTQPTAFGNVLAATADYPRLVYAMDTFHWLPRLIPLLPAEFQELLRSMESPMRCMLNLSLVFSYLAFLAVVVLGLMGSQELTALLVLVVGVVLSQLCYRAAVSQATDLARTIWVAFDLYRFSILDQLREEAPADLDAEHALWQRLAARLHELAAPMPSATNAAGATNSRVADS
ncbi:MAG: hypothetical protein K0S78_3361 [Thermomicrobiales bacterium]|nr:hypothetical protein [Thermomicrobiales bacterium]